MGHIVINGDKIQSPFPAFSDGSKVSKIVYENGEAITFIPNPLPNHYNNWQHGGRGASTIAYTRASSCNHYSEEVKEYTMYTIDGKWLAILQQAGKVLSFDNPVFRFRWYSRGTARRDSRGHIQMYVKDTTTGTKVLSSGDMGYEDTGKHSGDINGSRSFNTNTDWNWLGTVNPNHTYVVNIWGRAGVRNERWPCGSAESEVYLDNRGQRNPVGYP